MSSVAQQELIRSVAPKTFGETADADQFSGRLLINRELSLLEFHKKVLEEALDLSNPLLERLKFLSIFSSNIDEFFMIRVSGLKEELEENVTALSPDGMTPAEQLAEIRDRLLPMLEEQMLCFSNQILPLLKAEGIVILSYSELSRAEQHDLNHYFAKKVFPILTPLAVDRSHPFPYISPLSLNLGVIVEVPEGFSPADPPKMNHQPRFVRIKVPATVPRLVKVGFSETKFVLLEDLIEANLASLFPGMLASKGHRFRVTRDADIEIREEEAGDLLSLITKEVRKRRFGSPVRLEVSKGTPVEMIQYLTASLKLLPQDVYVIDGPLGLSDFICLYDLDFPSLKDPLLKPKMPPRLNSRQSLFEIIKERDLLLHHPYDSYEGVTNFINEAVEDEDVMAIKMCLYRTGPDSPIPPALIRAAEQGKQVTALIELKARFDEEHNIEWARRFDEAGVHVVFGIMGLKIHSKLTLVVRREGDILKNYVHIASGNYNSTTSCTYTDLGLFTADDQIGADAIELFNYLTGYSRQTQYRKLLVAPVNLREKMETLIEREIEHKKAGRPARIVAKFNRLADKEMINKLYEASQAGVRIELIVRGICMLRPNVVGVSETITVRSVVGRFLEHSRVFYFANGGEEEIFIGSADWMSRNLKHRIEVLTPVSDVQLKTYLKDIVLGAYLKDNVKARQLLPNGSYMRVQPANNEQKFDCQAYFVDCEAAP